MKCEIAGHVENKMQQCKQLQFASSATANIKLSKLLRFILLTSNKFITKSKNIAAKTLCGGVVALKMLRKLTCDG